MILVKWNNEHGFLDFLKIEQKQVSFIIKIFVVLDFESEMHDRFK